MIAWISQTPGSIHWVILCIWSSKAKSMVIKSRTAAVSWMSGQNWLKKGKGKLDILEQLSLLGYMLLGFTCLWNLTKFYTECLCILLFVKCTLIFVKPLKYLATDSKDVKNFSITHFWWQDKCIQSPWGQFWPTCHSRWCACTLYSHFPSQHHPAGAFMHKAENIQGYSSQNHLWSQQTGNNIISIHEGRLKKLLCCFNRI